MNLEKTAINDRIAALMKDNKAIQRQTKIYLTRERKKGINR